MRGAFDVRSSPIKQREHLPREHLDAARAPTAQRIIIDGRVELEHGGVALVALWPLHRFERSVDRRLLIVIRGSKVYIRAISMQ